MQLEMQCNVNLEGPPFAQSSRHANAEATMRKKREEKKAEEKKREEKRRKEMRSQTGSKQLQEE